MMAKPIKNSSHTSAHGGNSATICNEYYYMQELLYSNYCFKEVFSSQLQIPTYSQLGVCIGHSEIGSQLLREEKVTLQTVSKL